MSYLRARLSKDWALNEQIEELTRHGTTIRRYVKERFEITGQDMANAIVIAEAIIKRCEERMSVDL